MRAIRSPLSVAARIAVSSRRHISNTKQEQEQEHSLVSSDDTEVWAKRRMQAALESGKVTTQAHDYFAANFGSHSEIRASFAEAQRIIGNQDVQRFTKYQQQMIAERLTKYSCGLASNRMQKAYSEEQAGKAFTKEGKPTGESYWFEEPSLVDPHVPGFVKEAILEDMKKDRRADSPAFEEITAANSAPPDLDSDADGEPKTLQSSPPSSTSINNHHTTRGASEEHTQQRPTSDRPRGKSLRFGVEQ